MKCAKPNNNGEYAAKRVSNDRVACDASINMNAKSGRARSRGAVWSKAIFVPFVLILVFALTLLALQTFEVGARLNSGKDAGEIALQKLGLTPVAQASDGAEWVNNAASGFASGSGSATDPYVIKTGAQLAFMAMKINSTTTYQDKYWVLGANIDLSAHDWTRPIGYNDSGDHYFMGWFNGCGYAIYGMNIPSSCNREHVGLFGSVYEMGDGNGAGDMTVIENFSLFGNIAFNTSTWAVGGVVGYQKFHVCVRNIACYVNITASGNMKPGGGVGGIVGQMRMHDHDSGGNCCITYGCAYFGSITANGDLSRCGGIAGREFIPDDSGSSYGCVNVSTCISFAKISCTGKGDDVGGVVGNMAWHDDGNDEWDSCRLCCSDVIFAGSISVGSC